MNNIKVRNKISYCNGDRTDRTCNYAPSFPTQACQDLEIMH